MSLTFQILEALSDGQFHSGEQLAKQFNISRARVWQAVKQMRELGLEVAAVTGKGYKIFDGYELLNQEKIMAYLPKHMAHLPHIIIYPEIHSTNSVLSQGLRDKTINGNTVCLAECQSQGRGRLDRNWVSPLSGNIYCSLTWQFSQGVGDLMGLSLVAGLAIAKALTQMGAKNIGLKWPNDITWQGKKLGGILVEIAGDALGPCDVVIGVGLNMRLPRNINIDQAATDLSQVCQRGISRNQLIACIIAALYEYLPRFNQHGFGALLDEWLLYDILQQQTVNIMQHNETVEGIVTGVNEKGQLKVNIAGQEQFLTSAQVSVRAQVHYDKEINHAKTDIY